MNENRPTDAALRRRAEERLKRQRPEGGEPRTEVETARLVHELQVHQIELDMQNEELKTSRTKVAAGLALYSDLYDFAPTGYLTLDPEGAIRLVNLTGARLLGVERSRLVNRRFGQFVAEGDRRAFRDFLEQVFASQAKENCEVTLPQAGRPPLFVRLEGTRSEDGQECRAVVVDLTGRKRTEELLKVSFKEIGDLKSALDDHAIVAITDPQGKITYANDKFCAISQYSRAELLGQDHRLLNSGHHPEEFMRDLWTTITQGRVWHGEIKNQAKDGSFYWVDVTIVPFLNDQGKPRQYVAIRSDITERKAAEEKIHQLNVELEQRVVERTAQLQTANEELEAFSYSVSHDLRAPLRHVMGFVKLLEQDAGPLLSEKHLRHLTTISLAAKRMGNLIDDLLAFSRIRQSEIQMRECNLDQLVQEVLGDLQEETKGRNIAWEIHPLPAVRADASLLRMVLVNLISNAVKFTGARAEAKIEIGCLTEKQKAEITKTQSGVPLLLSAFPISNLDETVILIRDNGAGFDARYAHKLFGVFQRLHSQDEFEGTGIGLANVQRIIHRHGGRAWAEGAVDSGATFYFSIPK
jgi:PAS domain S-box-containing protein